MKSISCLIGALAAIAAMEFGAGATPAEANEGGFVVLAASGSGLPVGPGDVLDPGQEIAIADGTSLVMLDSNGRLYRMNGPCQCRLPGEAAGSDQSRLPKLATRGFEVEQNLWNTALPTLRDLSEPADRGAAAAGSPAREEKPGGATAQPDLWYMTVDSSGDRCVRRSEVLLWRREAAAEVTVDVRNQSIRKTGLVWPAGQQTMQLPDYFVIDGSALMVQVGTEPRQLVVHVLPDTIDEKEWGEILIWMAARDCRVQAQFLVDGLNDGTLFPDHDRKPGLSEL